MPDNKALHLYKTFSKWPLGRHLFSIYAARMAPYFASISPFVTELDLGYCEVLIKKRRKHLNHIGTVHVIAIANGLEMAMGFLAEASIPQNMRWIPKGMELKYLNKAGSDIRCFAKLKDNHWTLGDLPVEVEALDDQGKVVISGTIYLWVTEKPNKAS